MHDSAYPVQWDESAIGCKCPGQDQQRIDFTEEGEGIQINFREKVLELNKEETQYYKQIRVSVDGMVAWVVRFEQESFMPEMEIRGSISRDGGGSICQSLILEQK